MRFGKLRIGSILRRLRDGCRRRPAGRAGRDEAGRDGSHRLCSRTKGGKAEPGRGDRKRLQRRWKESSRRGHAGPRVLGVNQRIDEAEDPGCKQDSEIKGSAVARGGRRRAGRSAPTARRSRTTPALRQSARKRNSSTGFRSSNRTPCRQADAEEQRQAPRQQDRLERVKWRLVAWFQSGSHGFLLIAFVPAH